MTKKKVVKKNYDFICPNCNEEIKVHDLVKAEIEDGFEIDCPNCDNEVTLNKTNKVTKRKPKKKSSLNNVHSQTNKDNNINIQSADILSPVFFALLFFILTANKISSSASIILPILSIIIGLIFGSLPFVINIYKFLIESPKSLDDGKIKRIFFGFFFALFCFFFFNAISFFTHNGNQLTFITSLMPFMFLLGYSVVFSKFLDKFMAGLTAERREERQDYNIYYEERDPTTPQIKGLEEAKRDYHSSVRRASERNQQNVDGLRRAREDIRGKI